MTRAVAAGFERLESRQLFSAAALTIGGAPSPVDEGSSYSLNLSVSNLPSGTNVTDYSITWGDGQVTPITGAAATNPLVVNHTYLDGPALNLNVTATATLSDAEVLNSNTGSSTVTSDGSPDAAFGAGGTADTTLGLGAVTNNVAVQSNGQLVVAGVHGSTMSLVRLNSDGSVDGTFNLANPSLGVGTSSVARVLIETDPSDSSRTDYLVAGTVGSNGVLWRIHADDGTPDASFGIGGKLTLGTTQTLDDATLDPNGNIVTLGMHGDTVTATRLLADGSLDATFAGGEQTYAYDFTGSAYGVVATSDSVVAVTNGFTWVTGDTLSHLLKFTNAGLAGDAILQTNPSGPFSPSMHFDAIAMDANGNYVLGGRNLGGPSTASFAVARFDSNLNPDSSFGSGGFVTTTAVGQGGGATGIAVGADGKIVAVGVRSAAGQSVLARYDNTGLLDPSFGSGGIVLAGPSAGFVTPEAVVVQPDLKVLVPIIDASFTGPAGIVVRLGNSSNATSTPVTVNVNNVAPTPSINVAPSSGSEGTAISLSGSVTDPSPVDTAAGLGLAWSVTKNGLAYGGGGSGANFSFTPDDNGAYVVTLTATDKDGGSSSTDTPITVANVNPSTGAITSPAAAVRGQNVSFASSFTDPGVLDSHTVTWDFGDSSPAVTSSVGAGVTGAVSASHAFTSAGTFNVTLTVTDNDGGSGSSSKSFTVDIVDIQGGNLFVGGTAGCDIITINPGSSPGIQAVVNGAYFTNLQPTGRIVVFGGDGNDIIQVAGGITLNTELYGGNGNDLIKGGNGSNIIVGGAGDDVLVGGSGRDIVIGGAGSDALVTGGGDDVLVAMSTQYDNNATALESIQAEWTRSDLNFTDRANHLLHGGGLNGSNILSSATLVNDNATDVLAGGGGDDLFIISGGDIADANKVDLTWVNM